MYHFFFEMSKRFFRGSFLKEEVIDVNLEQIIDFCPKCNKTLEDKRVITLLKHEKKFHPKTEKELVDDFYRKGSSQFYLLMVIVGIILIGFYTHLTVTSMLWESGLTQEELEAWEFCKDLKERFPDLATPFLEDMEQSKLDRSAFIFENLEDFEKCNFTIGLISLGDINKQIENYLSYDD